jgi:heterodisulfide reductase subunit C
MHHSTVEPLRQTLKSKALEATGERVELCYQCGKCAAGCPLAEEFDYAPNQILRMLQLGFPDLEERVLRSKAIWLCLSCETCTTRCPKEVDFARIMDFLRSESLRCGMIHPDARKIVAFHNAFLATIKATGRSYEVGLIVGYKMRTGKLLQDVTNAPKLLAKGKLKLLPHTIKNKAAIKRMFDKAEAAKEAK